MTQERRALLREVLAPECPGVEQLTALKDGSVAFAQAEPLRRHLQSCKLCQAEWRALEEFLTSRPARAEREDVRAIVAQLTPNPSAAEAWWQRWLALPSFPRWAGAVAAVLIFVAVGVQYQARRVGSLNGFQPSGELRAGRSIEVAPRGNLADVPQELKWTAVAGAASYKVSVNEVDGTEIWRQESTELTVNLPAAVRQQILPRKTLVITVTALDAAGRTLAQTEPTRFQIMPPSPEESSK